MTSTRLTLLLSLISFCCLSCVGIKCLISVKMTCVQNVDSRALTRLGDVIINCKWLVGLWLSHTARQGDRIGTVSRCITCEIQCFIKNRVHIELNFWWKMSLSRKLFATHIFIRMGEE
jgi:hypothetical protein